MKFAAWLRTGLITRGEGVSSAISGVSMWEPKILVNNLKVENIEKQLTGTVGDVLLIAAQSIPSSSRHMESLKS